MEFADRTRERARKEARPPTARFAIQEFEDQSPHRGVGHGDEYARAGGTDRAPIKVHDSPWQDERKRSLESSCVSRASPSSGRTTERGWDNSRSRLLVVEEPGGAGESDQFRPSAKVEFLLDVSPVGLNGAHRHIKPLGDLGVGQS